MWYNIFGDNMNWEVIAKIIKTVLTSFIFVVLIIPFIKRVAKQIGAIDNHIGGRHIHKKPIPKLGGIAIFLGFLFGYMIYGTHSSTMNAVLIGSFIIILTGVVDDITELSAKTKFAGQLMAALVLVFYGNILLRDVSAFGIYLNFNILSYPLTIFFILGCINCINLIDGLDGLSGGISSIYFLTIGIIATMQGRMGLDFVLSFVMLGATLGFLVYNFNPASIFAGDSGSMFMGLMISVIALLGFKNVTMTSLIIPLLVIAIPILDTIFAIIRRMLKGEKITDGDKYHIHHQLLNRHFSQRATVIIIYMIDMLFAMASIVYVTNDHKFGYIIYGVLLFIVITFVAKTNVVVDNDKKKEIKKGIKKKLKIKKINNNK